MLPFAGGQLLLVLLVFEFPQAAAERFLLGGPAGALGGVLLANLVFPDGLFGERLFAQVQLGQFHGQAEDLQFGVVAPLDGLVQLGFRVGDGAGPLAVVGLELDHLRPQGFQPLFALGQFDLRPGQLAAALFQPCLDLIRAPLVQADFGFQGGDRRLLIGHLAAGFVQLPL